MARRLFASLSVLSLLLCLATAVLWVRSYRRADSVGYWYGNDERRLSMGMATFRGTVWFYIDDLMMHDQPGRFYYSTALAEPLPHVLRLVPTAFGGFGYDMGEPLWLLIPYWAIALATSLFPFLWLLVWLRRRTITSLRERTGRCPACGFDLRASPDRCPECGATTHKGRHTIHSGARLPAR